MTEWSMLYFMCKWLKANDKLLTLSTFRNQIRIWRAYKYDCPRVPFSPQKLASHFLRVLRKKMHSDVRLWRCRSETIPFLLCHYRVVMDKPTRDKLFRCYSADFHMVFDEDSGTLTRYEFKRVMLEDMDRVLKYMPFDSMTERAMLHFIFSRVSRKKTLKRPTFRSQVCLWTAYKAKYPSTEYSPHAMASHFLYVLKHKLHADDNLWAFDNYMIPFLLRRYRIAVDKMTRDKLDHLYDLEWHEVSNDMNDVLADYVNERPDPVFNYMTELPDEDSERNLCDESLYMLATNYRFCCLRDKNCTSPRYILIDI